MVLLVVIVYLLAQMDIVPAVSCGTRFRFYDGDAEYVVSSVPTTSTYGTLYRVVNGEEEPVSGEWSVSVTSESAVQFDGVTAINRSVLVVSVTGISRYVSLL